MHKSIYPVAHIIFADKLKLFSVQISKLDTNKLSQETIIKDLKANISSLQSKLNTLEKEHDDLEKRHSSHTIQADSELKELQQVSEEQVKRLTEVVGSKVKRSMSFLCGL